MNSAHLYAILDLGYVPEAEAPRVTTALLAGGADVLQLRAKGHDLATVRRIAEEILPLCRAAGVPFILNDHPALAGEIGADGVHIGQDDGSLEEARALFQSATRNPQSEIAFGRSTHSLDQARAALAEGFDYIGFGPLFPTPTKAGRPAIGLDDIAAMERDVGSKIPAFCIGGIHAENLPQVLAAGARRCVIVSHLLTAPDIAAATSAAKVAIADCGLRIADCGLEENSTKEEHSTILERKAAFQQRTVDFALRAMEASEAMPASPKGRNIADQLCRSATSVAANYRAACRAKSRADFISKMGTVEEEADEALFWLELIVRAGILPESRLSSLMAEGDAILAMVVASIKTAKRNRR